MAGKDEQASDWPSGVAWLALGLAAVTVAISMAMMVLCGFVFPVAAVVDLAAGPVHSSHGFLRWWVSPSQGWLILRSGWFATLVLVFAIWAPRLMGLEDDPDPLPEVVNQVYMFGWFLFGVTVLVCLFAATDLQAAHDHAAGPSQCFAAGPSRATGSIPGVLSSSDAMYFAIGNLTTAGTGQIAPLSSGCRALIAWQTAIGAVLVLFGVAAVITHVLQWNVRPSKAAQSSDEKETRPARK